MGEVEERGEPERGEKGTGKVVAVKGRDSPVASSCLRPWILLSGISRMLRYNNPYLSIF